ncbi:MAG: hypothetical protein JO307_19800 [Bryobacterales bacterium]|nr:hypothetical protein [Bryobacterales bacterium]MBV9401256.1 hypothetical protein [Bryobacterales bacterium]
MVRFAALSLLLPISVGAQWLNLKTPGIPRTADGEPNLTAPAPRTPDNKPDLSGLWRPEPSPYRFDLIQDLKDEGIFTPAAHDIFLTRVADFRRGDPVTHCLPGGPLEDFTGGAAQVYRIIQSPAVIAIIYESGFHRQIFMDGRELPKDPNPSWMGYSVGHWQGDTLVVESAGFNDRTWLDRVGHPHSEDLRVTETFRRVDFGNMQFQITYNDPKMLTKTLTIPLAVNYAPDTDMLETVCNENEKDTAHLAGKATAGVKVDPAILEQYTGKYIFRKGPPVAGSFFPQNPTVTLINGQLYLNDLPLIPQSPTRFDSTAATIEFSVEDSGKAMHFTLNAAEGDLWYERRR